MSNSVFTFPPASPTGWEHHNKYIHCSWGSAIQDSHSFIDWGTIEFKLAAFHPAGQKCWSLHPDFLSHYSLHFYLMYSVAFSTSFLKSSCYLGQVTTSLQGSYVGAVAKAALLSVLFVKCVGVKKATCTHIITVLSRKLSAVKFKTTFYHESQGKVLDLHQGQTLL